MNDLTRKLRLHIKTQPPLIERVQQWARSGVTFEEASAAFAKLAKAMPPLKHRDNTIDDTLPQATYPVIPKPDD